MPTWLQVPCAIMFMSVGAPRGLICVSNLARMFRMWGSGQMDGAPCGVHPSDRFMGPIPVIACVL